MPGYLHVIYTWKIVDAEYLTASSPREATTVQAAPAGTTEAGSNEGEAVQARPEGEVDCHG